MSGFNANEMTSASGCSLFFGGFDAICGPFGLGKDSAGAFGLGIVMYRNSSPRARGDR